MGGDAFFCGLLTGAVIGGAAACALNWDYLQRAASALRAYYDMRALLWDLQTAEGRYRQAADTLGENHRQTHQAWDDMRDAGNAARTHLFNQGRA